MAFRGFLSRLIYRYSGPEPVSLVGSVCLSFPSDFWRKPNLSWNSRPSLHVTSFEVWVDFRTAGFGSSSNFWAFFLGSKTSPRHGFSFFFSPNMAIHVGLFGFRMVKTWSRRKMGASRSENFFQIFISLRITERRVKATFIELTLSPRCPRSRLLLISQHSRSSKGLKYNFRIFETKIVKMMLLGYIFKKCYFWLFYLDLPRR